MTTMDETNTPHVDYSDSKTHHVPGTKHEISTDDATSAISGGVTRSILLSSKKVVLSQLAFVKLQLKKTAFSLIRRQSGAHPTDNYIPSAVVEEGPIGKPPSTVKPPNEIIGFIRNTVLQVAAFGVYDLCVSHERLKQKRDEIPSESERVVSDSELDNQIDNSEQIRNDTNYKYPKLINDIEREYAKIPLSMHFAAGALSGLVQSAIIDLYEIGHYWYLHRSATTTIYDHLRLGINRHAIIRRARYHVLGFATLFGCYETIRRTTVHHSLQYLASGSDSVAPTLETLESFGLCERQAYNINENRDSNYNVPIVPLGAAFFAGGIAGQLNFVMNSYSRQVKVLLDTKPMHLHHPSGRSILNSFLPMALSFLAFQYAGDITESLLHENIDDRQKFLVMVRCQPSRD